MMQRLALLTVALALWPAQGTAAPVYPWCAHYMMKGAPHSCGFVSFEQCLASVQGIGGSCNRNPFYEPPTTARVSRKADTRR
jgi:hypothetical protein